MTKIRTAAEEMDLLLLDLEMDGLKLAKAVKRNQRAQERLLRIMNSPR